MKNEYTMSKAFAAQGTPLQNCRTHWTSVDGNNVTVSLMSHQFSGGLYRDEPKPGDNRRGRVKAIKDLKYARDFCGGYFGVVMAIVKDGKVVWMPRPNLRMRLLWLDERTGAFIAKVVDSQDMALAA